MHKYEDTITLTDYAANITSYTLENENVPFCLKKFGVMNVKLR